MGASYEARGNTAIITMANPPVNSLSHAVRSEIMAGLRKALADDAIAAVVVTGSGRAFSGGADIREFNTPEGLAEPTLRSLIFAIEEAKKPVIAAVNGLAMGGGLELAMACHYRLAAPGAQIGLPEVKLGLLPGAGGTQRLPRLVGVETALSLMVTGSAVPAEELAATRLFDRIIAGDFLAGALAFAREAAEIKTLPRVRDITLECLNCEPFFAQMRAEVAAASRHFPAPMKIVSCVEAAVTRPFDEGLKIERGAFVELLGTTESRALRHYFFSERAAAKIPDVPPDTPRRAIRKAAVIGGGTMGRGIAMNFANAGLPVTVLEVDEERLRQCLAGVRGTYETALKKGRLRREEYDRRLGLVTGTLSYDDVRDADIVIEAVFEEMEVKEEVFRRLDAVMKEGAILATNTSSLDVNRIASFTGRPQDVLGMHFFSPAHVMRLLEVVRGEKTARDVLATVMDLARRIRKVAVVSGVCDGFIGNRMLEQYLRQAGFLLEEGCLPQDVDMAAEAFGFAMGPFRMSDLAGNDVGWHIRRRRRAEHPGLVFSETADLLCQMGRFGQKTGAGWYDYRPGDRKAYPSAAVNEMIISHSLKIGVERRNIGQEEIVERLVYSLVNEAAHILAEGIAQRASDIDLVYLTGYGFPLHRGGPLFYADTVGLAKVVAAMERYAKGRHGQYWRVAPLLERLAAGGKTFTAAV